MYKGIRVVSGYQGIVDDHWDEGVTGALPVDAAVFLVLVVSIW